MCHRTIFTDRLKIAKMIVLFRTHDLPLILKLENDIIISCRTEKNETLIFIYIYDPCNVNQHRENYWKTADKPLHEPTMVQFINENGLLTKIGRYQPKPRQSTHYVLRT